MAQLSSLRSSLSATLESASFAMTTQTRHSPTSVDKSVAFRFEVGSGQYVSVGAGYLRVTPFPEDFPDHGHANLRPAWRFKAVPVRVAYAVTLRAPERTWVPLVRVGASYYFSSFRRDASLRSSSDLNPRMVMTLPHASSFVESMGLGYGFDAGLGLRANLDSNIFVLFEPRISFVDGLAFTPGRGQGLDASFLRMDFNLGLGFHF